MRPLQGILVVSLEHAIAAPFCTRQLADLGARVIKIERPGEGDFARDYDARVTGSPRISSGPIAARRASALDVKTAEGASAICAADRERGRAGAESRAGRHRRGWASSARR